MKPSHYLALLVATSTCALAQSSNYINYVRQVQFYETGNPTEHDMTVAPNGQQQSLLAINPGGARFELWTFPILDLTNGLLLSSTYVATYMPVATVTIVSQDDTSVIPRTRADMPFEVQVNITNLQSGPDMPDAAKSVNFYHHVQSYGVDGTGINIDRTQAQEFDSGSITANGDYTYSYSVHSVPATDLTKARGEERFSIFSLEDTASNAPASELDSATIQVWPVADGSISGMSEGQNVRYRMPELTLSLNDLYPSSTTYLQVYKGAPALGTTSTVVPGSAIVVNEAVPMDKEITVTNYDEVVDSDGVWTFELLTSTPFGIDRLAYVSINVNRSLDVKASLHTIE